MSSKTIKQSLLTDEEFYILAKEGQKQELIDGVMIVASPTFIQHKNIHGFLFTLLRTYVTKKNLGIVLGSRTPVRFSKYNVFEPDISFIAKKYSSQIKKTYIDGAPDLVIETTAPSSYVFDTGVKKQNYAKYDVLEYWLIDPDKRKVSFYQLKNNTWEETQLNDSGVYYSPVVEGFWVDVKWFWDLPIEFDIIQKLLQD